MKIAVARCAVIEIPDDIPCQNVLYKLQYATYLFTTPEDDRIVLSRIKALVEQNPKFDIMVALTTVTQGSSYEYVVHCIQYSWYAQLEWIFEQKLVSPDFVSNNGSPLILFAMQAGVSMFQYILSKGAKLVVGGDLVKNNTDNSSIDALYCANGNKEILHTLFNVCNEYSWLTNEDTITKVLYLGYGLGRSCEQMLKFRRRYELAPPPRAPFTDSRKGYVQAGSPCDMLLNLVMTETATSEALIDACKECSPNDIRVCMAVALSLNTTDTYNKLLHTQNK